jgi:hypothetical protein
MSLTSSVPTSCASSSSAASIEVSAGIVIGGGEPGCPTAPRIVGRGGEDRRRYVPPSGFAAPRSAAASGAHARSTLTATQASRAPERVVEAVIAGISGGR